ncbi:MAG TPA: uroporphyrinogen decarboxylase family protein [Bryobacteraceae bacterium]|nr:uroporphyrinogen decarboxylase family protein [Bryobacteraceae bacterium]
MNSKERVLRNYSFQTVDRFTIDFCAESSVYARLRAHFGAEDDLELMKLLHVDFRYPKPKWIGFPLVDKEGRPTDYFGIPRRGVGDFGYPILHPLAEVSSVEEVEAYPYWPTADMWDYDDYARACASFDEYAVLGGAWGWFFEAACELVGMDRFFFLMVDKPEVAHALLERAAEFMERTSQRMFEKAGRYIDICFTGDDYGFQKGPMMSSRMFQEFARPYLQRIYDVGRKNGKPVMHHSCGSVAKLIPALMEMGLNILEPIQVAAAGMDAAELAAKYGGKLCFHGSIDTQGTLPFGTPEDVRREVRQRVETFKPYGGFTIAPSQHLLEDVPVENIVAMYEAAWEYCWLS